MTVVVRSGRNFDQRLHHRRANETCRRVQAVGPSWWCGKVRARALTPAASMPAIVSSASVGNEFLVNQTTAETRTIPPLPFATTEFRGHWESFVPLQFRDVMQRLSSWQRRRRRSRSVGQLSEHPVASQTPTRRIGDACDVCPPDPTNDEDGDGCADSRQLPVRFNALRKTVTGTSLGTL